MTTPLDRLAGQLHAACNLADRMARQTAMLRERIELDRVSAELASLANAVMRLSMAAEPHQVFAQPGAGR